MSSILANLAGTQSPVLRQKIENMLQSRLSAVDSFHDTQTPDELEEGFQKRIGNILLRGTTVPNVKKEDLTSVHRHIPTAEHPQDAAKDKHIADSLPEDITEDQDGLALYEDVDGDFECSSSTPGTTSDFTQAFDDYDEPLYDHQDGPEEMYHESPMNSPRRPDDYEPALYPAFSATPPIEPADGLEDYHERKLAWGTSQTSQGYLHHLLHEPLYKFEDSDGELLLSEKEDYPAALYHYEDQLGKNHHVFQQGHVDFAVERQLFRQEGYLKFELPDTFESTNMTYPLESHADHIPRHLEYDHVVYSEREEEYMFHNHGFNGDEQSENGEQLDNDDDDQYQAWGLASEHHHMVMRLHQQYLPDHEMTDV